LQASTRLKGILRGKLTTNILGIIASPRKLGNCEIFIKEISRHFEFRHTLHLLRLSDFSIKPCKGCYGCLSGPKKCRQKDDLDIIISAMEAADALIVAAPTYFLGPNGTLKMLLDRGLCFYAHSDQLWHKPAIGIGVAGIKGKEGYTLLGIDNFLKSILADVKHRCIVYGALPGEIFLNQKNRQTARKLALALFKTATPPNTPCCPLCYGDTFQFLENNQIRCMLCSNRGILSIQNGQVTIKINSEGHDFNLNAEKANKHLLWLENMQERFLKDKSKLKKIVLPYRKEGLWIKPKESEIKK
jgi:multimeric flavodoxin WrbA